ncbi:hypothetical protein U1Q18_052735 [Sarracenia purpurea var. burkii]
MMFVKSSTLVFIKAFSSSKLVEGFGTWFSFSFSKISIFELKSLFCFSRDLIFDFCTLITLRQSMKAFSSSLFSKVTSSSLLSFSLSLSESQMLSLSESL